MADKSVFKTTGGHLLLIAAAGLLAYSNSLHTPFVFDDTSSIVENHIIRNMTNFLADGAGYAYNPRRFIGYLTFAFNYWFAGLNVIGYHIFNLAIHIGAAMLVYGLCSRSFFTPFLQDSRLARNASVVALAAALLFVAHPIQTEAVTYIVQRFASLATVFYLSTLILYVKARLAQITDNTSSGRYLVFYILSLVCAVASMKTKEISFTLPITVVLYECFFFSGTGRKRFLQLIPIALTLLIIPAGLLDTGKPIGELLSDVSEKSRAANLSLTRSDYVATQLRVVVTYVRLLFFPVRQNFDYDYPVYHSFLVPPVYLSFLFIAAILSVGVYLFFASSRGIQAAEGPPRQAKGTARQLPVSTCGVSRSEFRLIAFGIFWFFITLTVESSVIPITDLMVEHRLYLPSAGAFIASAVTGALLMQRFSSRARISVLLAVVIALTALTWSRNRIYADEARLWRDTISKSPKKPRPYSNLGYVLMARGEMTQAIDHFREALRLNPAYEPAYNNLGYALLNMGQLDQGVKQFRKVLDINPMNVDAHYNLGVALAKLGSSREAINEYIAALRLKPDDIGARNNLGIEYEKNGLVNDAIDQYRQVLKLDPDYVEAYYNLGVSYQKQGFLQDAIQQYQKALIRNPNYPEAHNNLAAIYAMMGAFDQALRHIQAAIRVQPRNLFFREHLAHIYEIIGSTEKAREERRNAQALRGGG